MSNEIRLALPAGTLIDDYKIESVLGTGGFGITYRATEALLDRTVAIKEFLPPGLATRAHDKPAVVPLTDRDIPDFEWGLSRFRREAQTLVAFEHPNIVRVIRYFEANSTGYLVMNYVNGRTLAEILDDAGTIEENALMELVWPLLDGLQAVHEKGFLHRDIKPANIFVREDGLPLLIDFGAARLALGEHSKTLTAIISAGYAPYEQYDSSGQQGGWTDIYAFGGVLYRCLTGIRPPDAPSRVSALVRSLDDPMQPLAQAAKVTCSTALHDAVEKTLAIREDDRPQSIAELRVLLGAENGEGRAAATPVSDAPAPDALEQKPPGHLIDKQLSGLSEPLKPVKSAAVKTGKVDVSAADKPAAVACAGDPPATGDRRGYASRRQPVKG